MALLIALLAIGAVIWGLSKQISSGRRPQFEILQKGLNQNEAQNDAALLAQLRAHGSDLTKRTDIVFYLYIPKFEDARAANAELQRNGYDPEVRQPLGKLPSGGYESRYAVVAHIQEVPTPENIQAARTLYEGLARRYNGEYDGWEAAVAP
jgi:hypothetical protein